MEVQCANCEATKVHTAIWWKLKVQHSKGEKNQRKMFRNKCLSEASATMETHANQYRAKITINNIVISIRQTIHTRTHWEETPFRCTAKCNLLFSPTIFCCRSGLRVKKHRIFHGILRLEIVIKRCEVNWPYHKMVSIEKKRISCAHPFGQRSAHNSIG